MRLTNLNSTIKIDLENLNKRHNYLSRHKELYNKKISSILDNTIYNCF